MKYLKYTLTGFLAGALLFAAGGAMAYNPPPREDAPDCPPENDACHPPLNVSSNEQAKKGSLILNTEGGSSDVGLDVVSSAIVQNTILAGNQLLFGGAVQLGGGRADSEANYPRTQIAIGSGAATGNIGSGNDRGHIAIGEDASTLMNTGSGYHGAIAIGRQSLSPHYMSTAIGTGSQALMGHTTALGARAEAKASRSIAIGYEAKSSGFRSVALGNDSLTGWSSTALGSQAFARNHSTAVGRAAHAGRNNSIALGAGAVATGDNQFVVGSTGGQDDSDREFSINEMILGAQPDGVAPLIYANRTGVGLGTSDPQARLDVVGDICSTVNGERTCLSGSEPGGATGHWTLNNELLQPDTASRKVVIGNQGQDNFDSQFTVVDQTGGGFANSTIALRSATASPALSFHPNEHTNNGGRISWNTEDGFQFRQTVPHGAGVGESTLMSLKAVRHGDYRMGIGTDNPLHALHVKGEICSEVDGVTNCIGGESGEGTVIDSPWIEDAAGNVIRNEGNVGIGRTPAGDSFPLDIRKNRPGDHTSIRVTNPNRSGWANVSANASGGYVALSKSGSNRSHTFASSGDRVNPNDGIIYNAGGALRFFQQPNAGDERTGFSAMDIDTDGNVNIGAGDLTVAGDICAGDVCLRDLEVGGSGGLDGAGSLWDEDSDGNIYRSEGNVGIGREPGSERFSVDGTVASVIGSDSNYPARLIADAARNPGQDAILRLRGYVRPGGDFRTYELENRSSGNGELVLSYESTSGGKQDIMEVNPDDLSTTFYGDLNVEGEISSAGSVGNEWIYRSWEVRVESCSLTAGCTYNATEISFDSNEDGQPRPTIDPHTNYVTMSCPDGFTVNNGGAKTRRDTRGLRSYEYYLTENRPSIRGGNLTDWIVRAETPDEGRFEGNTHGIDTVHISCVR